MPQTHSVSLSTTKSHVYLLTKPGSTEPQKVYVIEKKQSQVYVHYVGTDKRLDEWVSEDLVSQEPLTSTRKRKRNPVAEEPSDDGSRAGFKRRVEDSASENSMDEEADLDTDQVVEMTEEDFDLEHHRKLTANRNFDKVIFRHFEIKTWYFSPYPLTSVEAEPQLPDSLASHSRDALAGSRRRAAGINSVPVVGAPRSRPRTVDLVTNGLGRSHGAVDSTLWVCDRCLKYMVDGHTWEHHTKSCKIDHPPGTKVYERGGHKIWQVDGAVDKLYCQNLSLFGKLFIDIKTLFFDTDNFLFYIFTDGDSTRDHIIAFFSKEKVSYDAYNLACIVTIPPYQRQGYGMLLIEFSYELSRFQQERGTPERPLSDLGLQSYLKFWISVIVRYLRRLLNAAPPESSQAKANAPKKKKQKGWDGENGTDDKTPPIEDPLADSKKLHYTPQPDGSAVVHVTAQCTLEDLARATWLRVEDVAFTLREVGMLQNRAPPPPKDGLTKTTKIGSKTPSGASPAPPPRVEEVIWITRTIVEQVAKEWGVKEAALHRDKILWNTLASVSG